MVTGEIHFQDMPTYKNLKILAIDPGTREMGVALLEGGKLIHYGVKAIKRKRSPHETLEEGRDNNKDAHCLNNISELIDRYMPDAIVVEDFNGMGSRRCHRIQILIKKIIELAEAKNIKTHRFSRSKIREVFALHGAGTKFEIAQAIAGDFPELASRLPPPRKCYMSEDSRMSIFDAMSLAVSYFYYHN